MAKSQSQPSSSSRTPIVTILGHVDHGKTTLLDTIRKTNIAEKEHGGITQHIGAYQVEYKTKKISFIDTPGHEAFAKMRSQGADTADIAILVVAANDGVKPQTIESIEHIKSAKVPTIVALNKIDLPDINVDRVKKQITQAGFNLEEYGGDTPVVPLSAKTGKGIDTLLDMILLLAELNEVKEATPGVLNAVVIESSLSKQKGAVATVLVRSGEVTVGDDVVCADQQFRIRSLMNWQGTSMKTAHAGDPAEVLGWKHVPAVGAQVHLEKQSSLLKPQTNELAIPVETHITATVAGELEEEKLKLILKADTTGTLEAIITGLKDNVIMIAKGIGAITESDILLAKTTKSIVVAFNHPPNDQVKKLASSEKVLIKTYNIIYELFDEIDEVVEALRLGNLVTILGEARISALFDYKGETVAGVKVVSGRIARGDQIKIMRGETEIGRAKIKSLRHVKDDITKAELGTEAGVLLSHPLDLLTGDSIIAIG